MALEPGLRSPCGVMRIGSRTSPAWPWARIWRHVNLLRLRPGDVLGLQPSGRIQSMLVGTPTMPRNFQWRLAIALPMHQVQPGMKGVPGWTCVTESRRHLQRLCEKHARSARLAQAEDQRRRSGERVRQVVSGGRRQALHNDQNSAWPRSAGKGITSRILLTPVAGTSGNGSSLPAIAGMGHGTKATEVRITAVSVFALTLHGRPWPAQADRGALHADCP